MAREPGRRAAVLHRSDPAPAAYRPDIGPPPRPPPGAVDRPRLTSVLEVALRQRLTMLVAPPGYGKTVLMTQWAAKQAQGRVRWLTLRTDEDPSGLVEVVRATLGRAPVGWDPPRRSTTNIWPGTLVIDDLHLLSDRQALLALSEAIAQAPPSMHVVIATRVDPPLAFHHLALVEPVVVLRQEDLRFTVGEADKLLTSLGGRSLPRRELSAMVARTEGWAVVLQLAAISLRPDRYVESLLEEMGSSDRHLADYLTEQVLRQQPPDVQRFLLDTSVLERMTSSLCDATISGVGSAGMLDELERRMLFTTGSSAGGEWVRYHQLFRAFLLQRLREREPARERQLLLRAAAWHLERNMLDGACRYFTAAHAWDELMEVAVERGAEMVEGGRSLRIAHWLQHVPEPALRARADARLAEAAAYLLGGRPDVAAQRLEGFERTERAAGARVCSAMLRSICFLQRGSAERASQAASAARHALEGSLPDELPDVLGLSRSRTDVTAALAGVEGAALAWLGELTAARRRLEVELDGTPARCQIRVIGVSALIEAWSGHLATAEVLAAWALNIAADLDLHHDLVTAQARLSQLHVAVQRQELALSGARLDDLVQVTEAARDPLVAAALAIERADLALATGEVIDGIAELATRGAIEDPTLPPNLVRRRAAAECSLLLAIGDLEGAALALDRAPGDSLEVRVGRCQLAVEAGDLGTARSLLDAWPSEPAALSRLERCIVSSVVESLSGGDHLTDLQLTDLASVVAAAQREHHVGLFRWHHARHLARALYRHEPSPFLRTIVEGGVVELRAKRSAKLVEELTARELVVLQLLPTRMSNTEMAQNLDISLNTLKTHVKHIYRKLEVDHRGDAVRTAESLHLL